MKIWIGVALVAAAPAFGMPAAFAAEGGAAQTKARAATSSTRDVGARRIFRRHPAYAYVPAYYARPYYYRPYHYGVPAPFFLGFAYLPRD
jgi:hypothetical protein